MSDFGYLKPKTRDPRIVVCHAEYQLFRTLMKATGAGGFYSLPTVYTYVFQHLEKLPVLLGTRRWELTWASNQEGRTGIPAALLSWLPGVLHGAHPLRP
jgi:hypothetical protein